MKDADIFLCQETLWDWSDCYTNAKKTKKLKKI